MARIAGVNIPTQKRVEIAYKGGDRSELISAYLDLADGYGQVYSVDQHDTISAIDQQSGEVVWTQEDFARRGLTAPVAFSNQGIRASA